MISAEPITLLPLVLSILLAVNPLRVVVTNVGESPTCNPESTSLPTPFVVKVIVPCAPLDNTDADTIFGTFDDKWFFDKEPLILALFNSRISSAFGPNEPLIPALVKVLITEAFDPNEPLIVDGEILPPSIKI